MKLNSVLQELGLDERETRIYIAAIQLGPTSILQLAHKTGIHRPQLYKQLNSLINQGIFRTTLRGKRKYYTAIRPRELLHFLRKKESLLETYLPELEALAAAGTTKPKILYFEGREQVQNLLKTQHDCKSGQIFSFFPSKFMSELFGKAEMEEVIRERVRRRIHAKILRAQVSEDEFAGSELRTKALREVRYIPHDKVFKMGIVIFDNKVNLFSPIQENFGIQIESDAFSSLMKYFFECLWQISTPDK